MKSRDGKKLDSIRIALPYIDYFFPNYEEAAFLTDKTNVVDISDVLLDCGIKNVIIKRGREGLFRARQSKDQAVVQPFLNPHPIDTIGAGDNFVAGFISAILAKMPLLEAARYANAVARHFRRVCWCDRWVLSSQQVAEFIKLIRPHLTLIVAFSAGWVGEIQIELCDWIRQSRERGDLNLDGFFNFRFSLI